MNERYLPCSPELISNQSSVDNLNSCCPRQHFDKYEREPSMSNQSVWDRLCRTFTKSSYRRSCYFDEIDAPKNDLDFRLRTCYDHAQETFASKARLVVQPITISHAENQSNSSERTIHSVNIVNGNRREHLNEATKGQHIGSHHFANGKNGYSRVRAGAIPVD